MTKNPSTLDLLSAFRSSRAIVAGVLLAVGVAGSASADESTVASAAFRLDPTAEPVLLPALGQVAEPASAADPAADPAAAERLPLVPERVLARFGEAGSTRFEIHGGYGIDVKDSDNTVAQFGVAFTEFIEDGIAIRVELNGGHFSQLPDDAQGINLNLLFQWHFMMREHWSLYAGAGAGVLFTTDDVPSGGSSFNFNPQAGFGLTFDVADDVRAVIGAKWHHVSNANTFATNPGRDHAMIHGGLSFAF